MEPARESEVNELAVHAELSQAEREAVKESFFNLSSNERIIKVVRLKSLDVNCQEWLDM